MKILVIGSGGREHALVWALARSKKVKKIYCAPGNAGTKGLAENVDIKGEDLDGLLKFVKEKKVDLTVVGPEAPLVDGIVDLFEAEGLKIFGPNKDAAQLEGSKVFTKNILKKSNIPTADFGEFDAAVDAKAYLQHNNKYPVVVKADGLAAGKGVIICKDEKEAMAAIDDIMEKKVFGDAGNRLVIEEFLEGQEASILALTDGETILTFPAAQDHKRIFDKDKGPNTGGMGAYAPAPLVTKKLEKVIMEKILKPTIAGLKREGITYKGIMYAGLMMTKQGPKVLEYNVRFGDPETQVVLPLVKSDLAVLFEAVADGKLKGKKIALHKGAAVGVVLASKGYPGSYEKGKLISGLDSFAKSKDVIVFHAGTKESSGAVVTAGGRVLNLVALGPNIRTAIKKAYANIEKVSFDGVYYRKDIGAKALK